jgi:TRAP-type C4-dicarboxylate transport system permease small subunit
MTPDTPPAPQPMRPSAPTALPVVDLDLDTRIDQLEQRLVAREAWIRSTADSLRQSTRLAVTPRPWALPLVGAGMVVWLGWRWWHRRGPARPASVGVPATASGRHVPGRADLPWAGLMALAWPLVPASWRGRFSPAAAAAIVSTLLTIGRQLFRRSVR